jgi:hypothetical protein
VLEHAFKHMLTPSNDVDDVCADHPMQVALELGVVCYLGGHSPPIWGQPDHLKQLQVVVLLDCRGNYGREEPVDKLLISMIGEAALVGQVLLFERDLEDT